MTRHVVTIAAVFAGLTALYLFGRHEGAAAERIKARERAEAAINEVVNLADRARAMRRHCRDLGLRFNFETVGCDKG